MNLKTHNNSRNYPLGGEISEMDLFFSFAESVSATSLSIYLASNNSVQDALRYIVLPQENGAWWIGIREKEILCQKWRRGFSGAEKAPSRRLSDKTSRMQRVCGWFRTCTAGLLLLSHQTILSPFYEMESEKGLPVSERWSFIAVLVRCSIFSKKEQISIFPYLTIRE